MSIPMPTSSFSMQMQMSRFLEKTNPMSVKTNWNTAVATSGGPLSWKNLTDGQKEELGRALRAGDREAASFFEKMEPEDKVALLANPNFARKLMKGAAEGTLSTIVSDYLAGDDVKITAFNGVEDVWSQKSGYLMHRPAAANVVLKFLLNADGTSALSDAAQTAFVDDILPKTSKFASKSTPLPMSEDGQTMLVACLNVFGDQAKVKILTAFAKDATVLAKPDVMEAVVPHLSVMNKQAFDSRLSLATALSGDPVNFEKQAVKSFVANVVGDLKSDEIHQNKTFLDTVAAEDNLSKIMNGISSTQKIGLLKTLSADGTNVADPVFVAVLMPAIGALSTAEIANVVALPMAVELGNTLSTNTDNFKEAHFAAFLTNLIGDLNAADVVSNATHLNSLMSNVVNHLTTLTANLDDEQSTKLAAGLSTFAQATTDTSLRNTVVTALLGNEQLSTCLSAEHKLELATVLSQDATSFTTPAFCALMADVIGKFDVAGVAANPTLVQNVMASLPSFKTLTNQEKIALADVFSKNSTNFENKNFQQFILDLKEAVPPKEILQNKQFWLKFNDALGTAMQANASAFDLTFRNRLSATKTKFDCIKESALSSAQFNALPLWQRGVVVVVCSTALVIAVAANRVAIATLLHQAIGNMPNLADFMERLDWAMQD